MLVEQTWRTLKIQLADDREMVVVPPFWTIGQTIDFLRSSELDETSFI